MFALLKLLLSIIGAALLLLAMLLAFIFFAPEETDCPVTGNVEMENCILPTD